MERSFSVGAPGTGNTIKLYATDVTGADNVDGIDSMPGLAGEPAQKRCSSISARWESRSTTSRAW